MKKKGFTLIELIAVIVVLAIITLIAVPIISKVVDKARKGAAEASALNYIDAVEKYVILHDLDSTKYPYDLKNNTFNVSSNTEISLLDIIIPKAKAEGTVPPLNNFITVKGDKPKDGIVSLDNKGKVTNSEFYIKGYSVMCTNNSCNSEKSNGLTVIMSIDGEKTRNVMKGESLNLSVTINRNKTITWTSSDENIATVSNGVVTTKNYGIVTITASVGNVSDSVVLNIKSGATKIAAQSGDTHKGVVYLNPANLGILCNASNSTVGSGNTGCMKWYIFDDSTDKYKLILDHDTAYRIRWNSSDVTIPYENSGVKTSIDSLNWESGLNKRIISVTEINKITGKTGFVLSNKNSGYNFYPRKSYAWLFDYTYNCENYGNGCNVSTNNSAAYGYWTSDIIDTQYIWCVYKDGNVSYINPTADERSVRPVIEVDKSIIN